jgi:DNA repair protein SbcC/Rad50
MIPKRIELENFLSFGKPAAQFTFTDDEPLWALCGRNGVGKSAVFDGITYALYGEHRGGSREAERLIRHGANGFRVVLEFEFAGVEYRITRIRAGQPAQKVERRRDSEWEAIPGVNKSAEVKAWVERTLGLGYKAFTTSVLLRQGEADKLFSADREERIALLKGIIGFERFEDVSKRVHAETLRRENTLGLLRRQLGALMPVPPDELAAAAEAVSAAEQARGEAQVLFAAAVQRVEQAKRWEVLEAKRILLEQQLAAAELRAADAATIRNSKTRLDDLATAVPELEVLVDLRGKITGSEQRIAKAGAARDRLAAAIELVAKAADSARSEEEHHRSLAAESEGRAKSLGEEIERGIRFLGLADALEEVRGKLSAYPADLADQVAQAGADETARVQARQVASGSLAAATALLQQARQQRDRFADVEVGAICSRCGQRVDEVHAREERDRLDREIRDREGEVEELGAAAVAAEEAFAVARERRASLQKDKEQFDSYTAQLAATRTNLAQLGAVADAAELRAQLAEQRDQKDRAEARASEERNKLAEAGAELARLVRERDGLDARSQAEQDAFRTSELELAGHRAAYNAGLQRLTEDWRTALPALGAEGVRDLTAERDRLHGSGVAAKYDQLRLDGEKRSEWSKQLGELRREIDSIPVEGRVPAKEAERRRGESKTAADAADGARDAVLRARDELKARAEQYEALTSELRAAERQHDVHKKLDDLLGQNGLLRHKVRDAEQQIVELANDTLQNLSDGDLSLEQDDEAAGRRDDKAFALRVRRAGDPLPIGVLFLSGSQKFRVAVSVALAVGRFARGRARPLESVIIDEGFGSLDKDGLRAMAEELKRLQKTQSLRRVILVSHQEEFTDQFPVGYRLSPGDSGTTASPFRR